MIRKSILLLALFLGISGCDNSDDPGNFVAVITDFEMMDQVLVASGSFVNGFHETSGKASIYKKDGVSTLLIEDFKTDDGPNLNVYMSSDLDATDYVDLGDLKGIQGSMSYTLPQEFDVTQHNYALIWCVPFAALFGYAELN